MALEDGVNPWDDEEREDDDEVELHEPVVEPGDEDEEERKTRRQRRQERFDNLLREERDARVRAEERLAAMDQALQRLQQRVEAPPAPTTSEAEELDRQIEAIQGQRVAASEAYQALALANAGPEQLKRAQKELLKLDRDEKEAITRRVLAEQRPPQLPPEQQTMAALNQKWSIEHADIMQHPGARAEMQQRWQANLNGRPHPTDYEMRVWSDEIRQKHGMASSKPSQRIRAATTGFESGGGAGAEDVSSARELDEQEKAMAAALYSDEPDSKKREARFRRNILNKRKRT